MRSYSVRDVERVLRLSPDITRNLIKAGFVKPARGARREYRFSFQDQKTTKAGDGAKIDMLSYAHKLFFYFLLLNHKYIC